jgi:hypothetical protein
MSIVHTQWFIVWILDSSIETSGKKGEINGRGKGDDVKGKYKGKFKHNI